MKRYFLLLCFCAGLLSNFAENSKDAIRKHPEWAASSLSVYCEPVDEHYTPAPTGYKPFYISTFARHGSRNLTMYDEYTRPLAILQDAYNTDNLTSAGKRVREIVDSLYRNVSDRVGELTEKGAMQHRGIARRMYQNFPEVFTNGVQLVGRSTPVLRCVLSMFNEVQELKGCCPEMEVDCNASQYNISFLDMEYKPATDLRDLCMPTAKEYKKKHIHSEHICKTVFANPLYVEQKVNKRQFASDLLTLASNIQNTDCNFNLFRYFSEDDIYNYWLANDYFWYLNWGPSKLSQGKLPYVQLYLFQNFLQEAEKAVAAKHNSITLRFGHDVDIVPLGCLLKLSDFDLCTDNPDEVAENWRNYRLFPMACNIQMVLFRKKGAPDLVKFMLNEREQRLPITSDIAPYYTWNDVRKYMQDIIANAPK